jgi:protocatechuate 3,4-dioxygenase beta subunit
LPAFEPPPVAERSALLFGVVHDEDGAPIAGASVCASCAYPACGEIGPARLHCATADAEGHYAFEELALKLSYRMLASASGHRPGAPLEPALNDPLRLDDRAPRRVDFVLQRGGAQLAGQVSDAFGGPVAGAIVTASAEHGGYGSSTRTDDDGRFALALEEGTWNVAASAGGYDSISVVMQAPSEHAELVLTMASSLRGRVVSAVDGTGVAGIEVRATKLSRLLLTAGDGSATSDDSGGFAIESLAPGSYEIVARGSLGYGSAPGRTSLAVGEHATGIEILVEPAVTVEGRVAIEPHGEPCASGNIRLATADSVSPDGFAASAPIVNGAVRIEGVPPGEYGVAVICPGYLARTEYERVHVEAANVGGLLWPVSRGLSVTGKLVGADGRGVAAHVVEALSDAEPDGYARALTSDTGDFELPALTPTRYRIVAADAPASAQPLDLSDGRSARSVRLTLPAAGMLEVHVTATAKATVAVQAVGSDLQRSARRTGESRFEVRDLAAGDYDVYASDGHNRPQVQRVTVTLAARTLVTMTLPDATAVLRGRVLDPNGAPVADVAVTVAPNRTPALSGPELKSAVFTQADGTFVVPSLIAGEPYIVQAEHDEASATLTEALPGTSVVLQLSGPS